MISRSIVGLIFSYSFDFWFIHFVFDAHFFLHSFGYWLWFGPLAGIFLFAIYATRKLFGISFSYID
jgi:hypothetical protein